MSSTFKDISGLKRIQRISKTEKVMSLKETIIYAIKNGIKMDILYQDDKTDVLAGYREISPAALGTHVSSNNDVLRAFLQFGVSKSKRVPKWRLFRLDRIKDYALNFSKSKVKDNKYYRMNDKHMANIECQIEKGFINLIGEE